MKLYIKPGACSMASHIILAEIGGAFAVEVVDTANGETAGGANYREINPKGKVPALEVEGEVLTEGPAILQFLGDRAVKDGAANLDLAPTAGTMARARVNEVLNFTGTELHAAFGPLFNPASTDAQKEAAAQEKIWVQILESAKTPVERAQDALTQFWDAVQFGTIGPGERAAEILAILTKNLQDAGNAARQASPMNQGCSYGPHEAHRSVAT